jgi:hypothetical protein
VKLNALLNKYVAKLQENQITQLKLPDLVSVRKQLIEMLQKDVQGFRHLASDYSDLQKVNENDVQKVIHDVKNKLGYYN